MKTLTSILVLLFGLQAATAQPLQRVGKAVGVNGKGQADAQLGGALLDFF